MRNLSAAWLSYHLEVLPKGAPEVQVTESRRAFYAGAVSVMAVLAEIGDDDAIGEEQGGEILEAMQLELTRFYEDIQKGRA